MLIGHESLQGASGSSDLETFPEGIASINPVGVESGCDRRSLAMKKKV